MKTLLIILMLCGFGLGQSVQYSNAEITEMEIGLERLRNLAIQSSKMPAEMAIPQLGTGIYKTSLTSIYVYGDREGTRKILQSALMAIPGHAEYYDQKIRKSMDDEMAGSGKGDGAQRMRDFQTLGQLPSPETVKVLGELLYDDRDPSKGMPMDDATRPYANFRCASMALTRLGIKKAPMKNKYPYPNGTVGYDDSEVETWKVWYEQVKAGTRTFSFEGDDTNYNLAGRTTVVRDGPIQSRPDRKASANDDGENSPTSNTRSPAPTVIIVLLLLGIAAFTVKKMKNRVTETK